MSIEGMWAIYFADVADRRIVNSGIMVLETGRIFGGDSITAYKGSYEVEGGRLSGQARVWSYNPTQVPVSAFGQQGTIDGDVRLDGQISTDGKTVEGRIWRIGAEDQKLGCRMIWVSDLP